MSVPQETLSVGALAEEQVRRTVKALKSAQNVSIKAICDTAGIGRATYFSRMNGTTSFTAGEVAELAELFGVEIADVYSGRVTLRPTPTPSGPAAVGGGAVPRAQDAVVGSRRSETEFMQ